MRKSEIKHEAMLSHLGFAVYERRLSSGMSQQDLADKTGLHRTYISDIERGTRNFTVSTLGRIAYALDTTASKLFRLAESQIIESSKARAR